MARFIRQTRGKCDWCFYDEGRQATVGLEIDGQVDWLFCDVHRKKFQAGDIPDDEPEIRAAYEMANAEGWNY